MKYPGVPPAGTGDAGSGWAHAGSDLELAARLLRRDPGPAARIQLAEVQRRAFATGEALRTLGTVDPADPLRPAALLCEGNVHWTVGDADRARRGSRRSSSVTCWATCRPA